MVIGLAASAVPNGGGSSRKDRGVARSGAGEANNGGGQWPTNGEIIDPMLIHPISRASTCCNNASSEDIFNQDEMEEEVRYVNYLLTSYILVLLMHLC